jgi:lysophospholipase L1-like esterase
MRSPVKFIRVLVALVVFGVSLELWARVDDYLSYGAPLWGPYNSEMLYTRDSLGRRGKPNARYRKWQLNELGFRGPALKPDRINILCFGASETFGLYESEGQEYPRLLERKLNERAGKDAFQVVNAAYPGESALTAAIRAPEIVASIHPRIAIVYPAPADYIWLPYLRPTRATSAAPAQPRFELRLGDRLRTFAKGLLPEAIQNRLRERETRLGSADFKVMDRLPEENVQRFHDDVTLVVQTLRDRGVVPVVVTHANSFGPTLDEDDRRLLISWRKFYPMLKEEGFLDMERRMNEALRAVAKEQNILLIDVAAEIPPTRQNFGDFVHFTNQGADVMAEKLTEALLPLAQRELQGSSARSGSE